MTSASIAVPPRPTRYVIVGLVVAALTALLLAAFVEVLGLDPRLGQALALSVLVPLSFLLSKRFAFRLSPDAA
jgi:putative flippase GtrA